MSTGKNLTTIGREAKKPSIYYDPLGLLQQDDPAAHGILVIQGPEELSSWLATLEPRISQPNVYP